MAFAGQLQQISNSIEPLQKKKAFPAPGPLLAEHFARALAWSPEELESLNKTLISIFAADEKLSEAFLELLVLALRLARPKFFWKKLKAKGKNKAFAESILKQTQRSFKLVSFRALGGDAASEAKWPDFVSRLTESPAILLLKQESIAESLKARDQKIESLKKDAKGKGKALEKSRKKVGKLKGLNSLLKDQVAAAAEPGQMFVDLQAARKTISELKAQLGRAQQSNAGLEERLAALQRENKALQERVQAGGSSLGQGDLEETNKRLKERMVEMQSKAREVQLENQKLDNAQRFNMEELVQLRRKVLEMEQRNQESDQRAEEAFYKIWNSDDGGNGANARKSGSFLGRGGLRRGPRGDCFQPGERLAALDLRRGGALLERLAPEEKSTPSAALNFY